MFGITNTKFVAPWKAKHKKTGNVFCQLMSFLSVFARAFLPFKKRLSATLQCGGNV